ncbi:MAG: hypothetical protein WC779_06110 [Candidatus Omnitrophota bacterium]
MKKLFTRTKFITKEPVQIKYLALLMLSMLIPLIFVGGCLYFLMFNIMAEQLGIPEYVAMNLFPVIKKINHILLIGFPPLFLLLLLWGVILSHRFAGPLERLKKELDDISNSGDYTRRLRVRKHDDIKPFADSVNKLLEKVSKDKTK